MKRLTIFAVLLASISFGMACNNVDNARNGSSNTGPEKDSLPSPDPPRTGVDANGNATVNSNNAGATNAAAQNDALRNNFWMTAAQGGIAEVQLGQIAQTKAANPEVKNFARMMVEEHTRANTELKALAGQKNINLPTTMNSGNQATLTELQNLVGADFDREYVAAMVDNHEADVQLFESQAADDSDPEAKAFAAKTLPTLRKHLEMIKAIQAKMK
jgi:putative membrane protein